MRKLLTLLLIVLSCFAADANPIKSNCKKGAWDKAENWNLKRVPKAGDTIVILKTDTLVIDYNLASSNVYLQVQGALQFKGGGAKLVLDANSTVLVEEGGVIFTTDRNASQVITIGGVEKYSGRDDVAITGPSYANSTTSRFTIPPPSAAPIPLPVKFLGFSAARKNADVLVQWATSQEMNADFYEVQRSEDGNNWKAIGTVKAVGTTNNTSNYSFTDKNTASKTAYYRIRQVDVDGRFEYTIVRTVKADGTGTVNAVATRGNIVLQFAKQVQGQVEVRLVSMSGQVISRQLLNKPVGQLVIPAAYKGHYILSVSDQQDIQINKQILL